MENNKNGDTVYVPFVLEVDYKVYEDGTHYALCRENGSTELVFKDLETAKKIFKELDEIKCKGNHKGSATYDNDKYMDVIHVEDYEALKKKYKVD